MRGQFRSLLFLLNVIVNFNDTCKPKPHRYRVSPRSEMVLYLVRAVTVFPWSFFVLSVRTICGIYLYERKGSGTD